MSNSRQEQMRKPLEVGVKYMRLWEEMEEARMEARTEGRKEGHAAGVTDGILVSIRNLMKQTGWPPEKALTMLDIPKDEHEKYVKLLEK